MAKASKNRKGFGVVEAISILVILILIAVVGWLIYKNHHSTKLKSYSDNYFSFEYPANWRVDKPASNIAKNNPTDATLVGVKAVIPSYMASSSASNGEVLNLLFYKGVAAPNDCSETNSICSVKIVTPLTTEGISHPKLVVFSQKLTCSQVTTCVTTSASSYELIDSASEKVGDSVIPQALIIKGRIYQVEGCSLLTEPKQTTSGSVCGTITNYQAFEASSDYKNLVSVLNSLTIK